METKKKQAAGDEGKRWTMRIIGADHCSFTLTVGKEGKKKD